MLGLGWPIPAAVDVALTYVVARSISGRHPAATFLLLLVIASNAIGLVFVSQRYAGAEEYPAALALLFPAVAGAAILRRRGPRSFWPALLVCGPLSWLACLWSGVHPALALLCRSSRSCRTARAISVNGGVLMRGFGGGTRAVLMAAFVGRPVGIAAGTSLGLAAGLHLPPRVAGRDIVLVAIVASTSFTFGLFFASAIFPVGSLLIQTRMGAMVALAGAVIAFGAARALHVGRFAVAGQTCGITSVAWSARPSPRRTRRENRKTMRTSVAAVLLSLGIVASGFAQGASPGSAAAPAAAQPQPSAVSCASRTTWRRASTWRAAGSNVTIRRRTGSTPTPIW